MNPVQVVGIGHPVINLGIAIDRLPESNLPANRLGMTWQVGGKIATAMSCISRLGFSSAIIGHVSSDAAVYVHRDLAVDGVDTSHLSEDPDAEPYFTVSLAESETGGRSFLSAPQPVRDLEASELDRELIARAEFLYLWSAGAAERAAAQIILAHGGQIVFDADTFSPEIEGLLPFIQHFIASEFYYRSLFGDSDAFEKNLHTIWEKQARNGVVIVTLGAQGLVGIDECGIFFRQETFSVPVVDTTGAGDVFHGAYTAGRLAGMNAQQAARLGCAVSSIKCTRLGCRAGLPTMESAVSLIQNGTWNETVLDERCRRWSKLPF